jgi:signal transduction histidine kinase
MKNKRFKWHIRPRIFLTIFVLLILVFAAVLTAFNVFIRSYIKADASKQLVNLAAVYAAGDTSGNDKNGEHNPKQNRSKLGVNGEVLILTSIYEIIKYESASGLSETATNQIADALRQNGTDIANIKELLLSTDMGEYYASSMRDIKKDNAYLVFFVDVTVANRLVDTVNFALVIISSAALLISFFIAGKIASSITLPIRKIAHFAEQIGKGNFAAQELVFTDAELTALAQVMNQSAATLSKYDSEQRTFFQNASHELRTPLMNIRCQAEGIDCGYMETHKASGIIISETDHLSEMVEDLLYISRIDSLTHDVEMQTNDLRETVEACVENIRPLAQKAGITVTLDFDTAPVLFKYNEKHLYRAVMNLFSNALRYANSTITVSCKTTEEKIYLSVADDGDGISTEDLPHIFERLYKGKNGKHGIGLSIVKSVVSLHGGNVTVSCQKGTTFMLTFPA